MNNQQNDNKNSEALADIKSDKSKIVFKHLSSNLPKVSAASNFLSWMIPVIIISLVRIFKPNIEVFASNILSYVTIGLLFVAIFSGIYGYFFAKSCGYLKREFDIFHKQGIWWKKQTALSFSRIQHIDLSSGPLDRKFGMATLKFFTAGGASSDLIIHGLPLEDAEELRQKILKITEDE